MVLYRVLAETQDLQRNAEGAVHEIIPALSTERALHLRCVVVETPAKPVPVEMAPVFSGLQNRSVRLAPDKMGHRHLVWTQKQNKTEYT